MRENPAAALAFYREKLLTQWLEPACDMLWSGQLSEKAGRYTGVIRGIYGAPGALRGWMEGYMDTMQTAVYALAAAGLCRLEDGAARLICSGKKWVQRRAECARTSHRD